MSHSLTHSGLAGRQANYSNTYCVDVSLWIKINSVQNTAENFKWKKRIIVSMRLMMTNLTKASQFCKIVYQLMSIYNIEKSSRTPCVIIFCQPTDACPKMCVNFPCVNPSELSHLPPSKLLCVYLIECRTILLNSLAVIFSSYSHLLRYRTAKRWTHGFFFLSTVQLFSIVVSISFCRQCVSITHSMHGCVR